MALPNAHGPSALPAMRTNPRLIFFTDWDGTVTLQDSNDYLTDNYGLGTELRRQLNIECLEGTKSFRSIFQDMMDSISGTSTEDCKRHLRENVDLDLGFRDFYLYARANNIPIVVLSSGLRPLIETLLEKILGDEAKNIQLVSNEAMETKDRGRRIVFHDASDFGHDKSLTLKPYAQLPAEQRPMMMYAGDGVSDLSAARETDLLFAKEGKDLVTFCLREGIDFTPFQSWIDILSTTKEIYEGKTTVQQVADRGRTVAKQEVAGA